jgi:hypothetical protein
MMCRVGICNSPNPRLHCALDFRHEKVREPWALVSFAPKDAGRAVRSLETRALQRHCNPLISLMPVASVAGRPLRDRIQRGPELGPC